MRNILYLIIIVILYITNTMAAELHVGINQTYSTISSAINASNGGDTIYIHAGTYYEDSLRPKSGIDQSHPTIISGYPGEDRPIIDAQGVAGTHTVTFDITAVSYILLKNLDVRGGGGAETGTITIGNDTHSGTTSYITIDHCKVSGTNVGGTHTSYNPSHIRLIYEGSGSHVVIKNCELTGADASGIKINSLNFDYITIENNYIHDIIHGIAFKWGDTTDRHCIVRNNLIQNGEYRGIYCDQSYITIQNNIIDSFDVGIHFGDNYAGSNTNLSHNTIYGSSNRCLYFAPHGSNNTIIDNILYSVGTISDYATGNVFSNNYTSDPLFIDADNNDFNLQVGSPAKNAASDGSDIGADVPRVGVGNGYQQLTVSSGTKQLDFTGTPTKQIVFH